VSYRLDLDQPPAVTGRRTLVTQLAKARDRFESQTDDPAALLHDIRKDLKKTRSLLRLMRPALTDETYKAEMGALRESARAISASRDADAVPAALAKLQARSVGRLPESTWATLETALAAGPRTSARDALSGRREALRGAAERAESWPLREMGWGELLEGVERTYRRGRKAFGRARQSPTVADLHEWRKRAKDLLYQTSLLEAAWPAVIEAYAEQAHRLSDLLGDDHDLAMLVATLRDAGGPAGQVAVPADAVIELAEQRRLRLERKAFRLGARLYGESPKALRQHLEQLVQAARAKPDEPPASLERAA